MALLDLFSSRSSSTNNTANYDLADASANAGDNSLVTSGGSSVNLNVTNVSTDQGAIDAAAQVLGQSLGLAVNSQTLAAQSLGVAVNGQTLQAELGRQATARDIAASDNALAGLTALVRSNERGVSDLLAASDSATRRATAAAQEAAAEAAAASRAASASAAASAADAIASADRSTRGALAFGSDALLSIENTNRRGFDFASDALSASISASARGVSAAENSLDSSLSFARLTSSAQQSFLGDVLGDVVRLVSDTADRTQTEAEKTRDFAGNFVGDFYESQKSGDVQTIQQIAKYGAIVASVLALAWAVRGRVSS